MVSVDETRYMISDAAKKVEVEAHVLRYWEEELELPIARTELGHRYYTADNIFVFQKIKELKENGFQLKAIKLLLPEIEKREIKNTDHIINLEEKLSQRTAERLQEREEILEAEQGQEKAAETEKEKGRREAQLYAMSDGQIVHTALTEFDVNMDKLQQFEKIVGNIVSRVVTDNNKALQEQISASVTKEMEYLMKIREEKEEERYRRLDETIRAHQKSKKLVAATKEKDLGTEGKRRFFWRKRQ